MYLRRGVALCLLAVPAQAEDLPALCLRGAKADPVPVAHVLSLEMQDYYTRLAERVPYPDVDVTEPGAVADPYGEYIYLQAIEWPGILADRAADLPKPAHDLPWLVLLAGMEAMRTDPVWALSQGPESTVVPHLLPILDRHGLDAEAAILRDVKGLFPSWDADPATRSVVDGSGNIVDESRRRDLEALGARWPTGENRAQAVALRLLEENPDLKAEFEARLETLDDTAILALLMQDLWDSCMADRWEDQDGDTQFGGLGSVQVALILMDFLAMSVDGPSLYVWFDSIGARHSEMLARLLERRGLTEEAAGLRAGMALFPPPFPDQDNLRWDAMAQMDAATLAQFDSLVPEDSHDRIRAEMLNLARENGLMAPRP